MAEDCVAPGPTMARSGVRSAPCAACCSSLRPWPSSPVPLSSSTTPIPRDGSRCMAVLQRRRCWKPWVSGAPSFPGGWSSCRVCGRCDSSSASMEGPSSGASGMRFSGRSVACCWLPRRWRPCCAPPARAGCGDGWWVTGLPGDRAGTSAAQRTRSAWAQSVAPCAPQGAPSASHGVRLAQARLRADVRRGTPRLRSHHRASAGR